MPFFSLSNGASQPAGYHHQVQQWCAAEPAYCIVDSTAVVLKAFVLVQQVLALAIAFAHQFISNCKDVGQKVVA